MLQVRERADVMIQRPEWVGQCDQSTGWGGTHSDLLESYVETGS